MNERKKRRRSRLVRLPHPHHSRFRLESQLLLKSQLLDSSLGDCLIGSLDHHSSMDRLLTLVDSCVTCRVSCFFSLDTYC